MDKIIAFCGLECSACPGYIATKNDDDDAREKIAKEWSKSYNADITLEYVNCDGCSVEGRHIGYCDECGVRKCASARGVENCAHCENYPCETLEAFHNMAPRAKANLEEIRTNL